MNYYGLSKELPVEELPRTTLHNPPRSKKQSGNQRKIEGNLFPNHCFFPLQLHGCSMIPGPPDPPPHIRNHANLYKDIDFNDSEVTAPPTTLPTPCKFVEVCCFSTIMVPFFLGRRILLSKSIVLLSKKILLLSKSTFLRGESMVLPSKSIVLLNKKVVLLNKTMVFLSKSTVLLSESMILPGKSIVLLNKKWFCLVNQ